MAEPDPEGVDQTSERMRVEAERDQLTDEIRSIQRRIDRLSAKQDELRKRRNRLTTALRSSRTWLQRSGMSDEWQVRAEDFVEHVTRWLREYEAEHDTGAQLMLSIRSRVSTKTISEVTRGKREMVALSTADMLLTACGAGWVLPSLELHPIKRGRPKAAPNVPPHSQYYEE